MDIMGQFACLVINPMESSGSAGRALDWGLKGC